MPNAIYSQQNLHENLLGYWPLNYTADNVVTGQIPTSITNITYTTGKIKNCASFNGTNSDIVFPSLNLNGLTQLTVSCWIKPDTITKYAFICSQWQFAVNTTFAFSKYSDGQITVHIADSNNDNPGNNYMFSTNANLQVGIWTHVAFVFNGDLTGNTNRLKIYQNGTQLSTVMGLGNVASRLYGSSTFFIGDLNYTDDTLHFDGDIEGLAIWSRALSDNEIKRVYNGGKGLQIQTTPGYDPDAQVWFNSMTTQPSTSFKYSADQVVKGLKQYNIWTELDYFLLAATENSQHALIPLKNPTLYTPVNNSMPWIINEGYNASPGTYFNTDFKPGVDGVKFQQNDASYGHYIVRYGSNILGANGCYDLPGTRDVNVFLKTATGLAFAINSASGNIVTGFSQPGLNIFSRTDSTTVQFYNNDTLVVTSSYASNGRPLIDYYLGARNANGAVSEYNTDETHAAFFAGSSNIDWTNFNIIMTDFALRRIGLLGFYPLNGDTQDYMYQQNGTGNHISYDHGKHEDQSAYFNGVTSYLDIPYTQINNATTELSVSLWVKVPNLNDAIFFIKYNDGAGNGDYFLTKASNKWRARLYGGSTDVISINDIVINTWTHLVFTVTEAQDLKFYVNGVLQGTTTSINNIIQSNNFNLSIGRWLNSYTQCHIQDVGIWKRILNDFEISRLYNGGAGIKIY